jgi:hypothetical protein
VIGESAFSACRIAAIVMWPSTWRLGGRGCHRAGGQGTSELRSVDMSATLLEGITEDMFSDCSKLCSVVFPVRILWIEGGAFARCSSLTCVDLSATSVGTIGRDAFRECMDLRVFTPPATLRALGQSCFFDSGLARADMSATRLERIGREAFRQCRSALAVLLPRRLGHLDANCFRESGLTAIDLRCTRVSEIPRASFADCLSLRRIMLPRVLEAVEESAFRGSGLLYIDARARRLARIGGSAFAECKSLEELCLPATGVRVGYHSFRECLTMSVDVSGSVTCLAEYPWHCLPCARRLIVRSGECRGLGYFPHEPAGQAFAGCVNLRMPLSHSSTCGATVDRQARPLSPGI